MADIDSDKEKYGVEYLRQNSTISETSSYKGTLCWIWSKVYSNNDYGAIWIPSLKKLIKVHRWSYICGRGDVPEGSLVRHMCHQKLCCNPIHLETGTHKDNWSDSESTHRTNYTNRRKKWVVDGQVHFGDVEAAKAAKVTISKLYKFSKEKVFDREAYELRNKIVGGQSKDWYVDGKKYSNLRSAAKAADLSVVWFLNYCNDRVFDREAYNRRERKKPWVGKWIVYGVEYESLMRAYYATGINRNYLSLFSNNGVFDHVAYETRIKPTKPVPS